MLSRLVRTFGGVGLQQRDLRILTISVFLTEMGVSIAFPLRMLYAQAHHATPIELGLIAAAFFVSTILVQVPLGRLVDSWGRVPMILLGTTTHAMIGVAYLLFYSPADLIALRFLEGACMAAIQPATFAYVADVTPERHRAEVFGLLTAAMSGGLLIGPLLGGAVGQAWGFVPAYISCTAIEACAALLAMLYLREPARHEQQPERTAMVAWRRLLTLPLVGAYAATLSFQVVMGIFSALWTIWLRDLGASYTYIGITFTVFALPQLLLGAIAGRAVDRIGRAPMLLWAGILVSIVYAAYGYMTNFWLVIALGIFEGVFLVFQQPAVRDLLADASPPDLRGTAQGIAGFTGAIGAATSAFASLPLYHASKPLPFVLAGAIMAAGSVVSAFAAMRMARAPRTH